MEIVQPVFQSKRKLLKGALHVHTTRSDGKDTPEDALNVFAANNYDFVALTDHNIYNTENFAPSTDLLIIPGMERDINYADNIWPVKHNYHIVCLGGTKERGNGYYHDMRVKGAEIVANQSEAQAYIDDMRSNGNIVFIAHPQWSGTAPNELDQLEGVFGMEVWNSGCATLLDMDSNAYHWDDMLGTGKGWFGLATDDSHRIKEHANGWVMVDADKDIDSIIDALAAGNFYSSSGPTIYDFRVVDDFAYIDCSPCKYAGFASYRRPTSLTWDNESASLTHAETFLGKGNKYIRGVVMDANGRRAWTQPIYLGERR